MHLVFLSYLLLFLLFVDFHLHILLHFYFCIYTCCFYFYWYFYCFSSICFCYFTLVLPAATGVIVSVFPLKFAVAYLLSGCFVILNVPAFVSTYCYCLVTSILHMLLHFLELLLMLFLLLLFVFLLSYFHLLLLLLHLYFLLLLVLLLMCFHCNSAVATVSLLVFSILSSPAFVPVIVTCALSPFTYNVTFLILLVKLVAFTVYIYRYCLISICFFIVTLVLPSATGVIVSVFP